MTEIETADERRRRRRLADEIAAIAQRRAQDGLMETLFGVAMTDTQPDGTVEVSLGGYPRRDDDVIEGECVEVPTPKRLEHKP